MIDPLASVHPDARLGDGCVIGPFAVIEPGAVIGDGCVIGPHAVVRRHTTLGPRCRLFPGAVIGDWPQDFGFDPATESCVRIGEECQFREGVTVHRGTRPGTETVLGDRVFMMANSHVAHNCRVGSDVIMANNVLLAGYVEVGDRVFLSGNATIHQFCRIGRLAMMSGLSGLSKDLAPFCIIQDLTSNTVGGLNVVGMRRAGFTPDQRTAVKLAYRLLFRSGLRMAEAAARIRAECPEGPAWEMADFAETSKRGLAAVRGE